MDYPNKGPMSNGQIGDGQSIFMWHDKWWDKGPMSDHIPLEAVKKENVDLNMKVNEMIDNETWKWPRWQNEFPMSATVPFPKLMPNSPDTTYWISNNGIKCRFSVSKVWSDLRLNKGRVPWCEMVWFSHCVPRHAFIYFMVGHSRKIDYSR